MYGSMAAAAMDLYVWKSSVGYCHDGACEIA